MTRTTRVKPKRPRNGRVAPELVRPRPAGPSRRVRQAAGHAPLSLIAATALALLVALGLLGWDLSEPWRNAPPAVGGKIAMPIAGGINLVDTGSGHSSQLVAGEANASVTAVAYSPDRATLAYTLFHRRPDDRVSSAELFTVPAAGGTPTLLVPRIQPGTIVDAPDWAPDGSSIYYSYQGVESGKPVARVERYGIADSSRSQLYGDAAFPAVAPDGRGLAFVYDNGSGQALRIGAVDGGDARELVPANAFRGIMGPRFSPDGAWIAFVAVGSPPGSPPGTAPGPTSPNPTGQAPATAPGLAALDLGSIFSVPVAEAHGDPWSIWKVRPDGRELQQVGSLLEDEPLIAWSQDGAWLAVHGTGGLWLVDVSGATQPRRLTDGTIGGIDW